MKKMLPFLMILTFITVSCDRRGPDQLLEDAEVNITQNKFDEAIKDLEKLVNKYPDHEKAVQTSYRIAELHMNKRQDLNAAIVSFKNAADKFPDSEVGPKACFMAGFLLANNTDRLDEAKKTYEKFLEKYPDHELKIAVEFELENLGKPLDNIPQLKPILEDNENLRDNRSLGK